MSGATDAKLGTAKMATANPITTTEVVAVMITRSSFTTRANSQASSRTRAHSRMPYALTPSKHSADAHVDTLWANETSPKRSTESTRETYGMVMSATIRFDAVRSVFIIALWVTDRVFTAAYFASLRLRKRLAASTAKALTCRAPNQPLLSANISQRLSTRSALHQGPHKPADSTRD